MFFSLKITVIHTRVRGITNMTSRNCQKYSQTFCMRNKNVCNMKLLLINL